MVEDLSDEQKQALEVHEFLHTVLNPWGTDKTTIYKQMFTGDKTMSVFDGMDMLALRTTAKMQAHLLGMRSNRIDELEHALNAAIGHIEMLMGSDADTSEDVAWLQKILNKECE